MCKTVVHTEFNFVLLFQIVISYRIKKNIYIVCSKMLTVLKNSGIHVYNSRKLQINSLIFCETLRKNTVLLACAIAIYALEQTSFV